jgi:hypothetical protein
MNDLLKCPRCSKTPESKQETYGMDQVVELACQERHYIAIGDSPDQARVNWNQLISFERKAA